MKTVSRLIAFIIITINALHTANAADVQILTQRNISQLVPGGKEVDAIIGDVILRNDVVSVVIAAPSALRNANLTTRTVGGCIIDLVRNDSQNDQLTCLFINALAHEFHSWEGASVSVDEAAIPAYSKTRGGTLVPGFAPKSGESVSFTVVSNPNDDNTVASITYSLTDGRPFVDVVVSLTNQHKTNVATLNIADSIRADRTFIFGVHDGLYWASDDWFKYAVGILPTGSVPVRGSGNVITYQTSDSSKIKLGPDETVMTHRRVVPADNLLQLKGITAGIQEATTHPVKIQTLDAAGPTSHAKVTIEQDDNLIGTARTDEKGVVAFQAEPGSYSVTVQKIGRTTITQELVIESDVDIDLIQDGCGYVVANITDSKGNPIPCKVSFYGLGETVDPLFGPPHGEVAVGNVHYSINGQFRQEIPSGTYQVLISHGPEYDLITKPITVERGKDTEITGKLIRSVDTSGWISADLHSHASPSGDNVSSQFGRVLSLISEHIEFAPCTEHQRIDTYDAHLARLQAAHLLATCPGMELTGQPLPINHQNTFPLQFKPYRQDGGGPVIDENPITQIVRLAGWDNNAKKLMQGNHPKLMRIYQDGDDDGNSDGGFRAMLDYMDVIEIHPPQSIFQVPAELAPPGDRGNVIFQWMQLLNIGYRIPGVVNSDAHLNLHESGYIRNFVRSSTDDPSKIRTDEMVDRFQNGNVMMTNGPFLEVVARSHKRRKQVEAIAGQDLIADEGHLELHIRIQCANWYDINRVQVFINGRMDPDHNYTRRTHPRMFSNDVVRFNQTISLTLPEDAHVIVATCGEDLKMGPVFGPRFGDRMPTAVTNPIFVDVNRNGFQFSHDDLGVPFVDSEDSQ